MRRLLVALAGPTGVIYGIRLLERLREVHHLTLALALSDAARRAIPNETGGAVSDVEQLAGQAATAAASRPLPADGMIIAPCDMGTAAAIAAMLAPGVRPGPAGDTITGSRSVAETDAVVVPHLADDLILTAAAEILRCRRPMIALVYQSPLGIDDLHCLLRLSENGAVILPPAPAFYNRPHDVEDIVLHTVARMIDRLGFVQSFAPEWQGSQRRT